MLKSATNLRPYIVQVMIANDALNSRITDVSGVIVYVIRFKNSFLHR